MTRVIPGDLDVASVLDPSVGGGPRRPEREDDLGVGRGSGSEVRRVHVRVERGRAASGLDADAAAVLPLHRVEPVVLLHHRHSFLQHRRQTKIYTTM